MRWRRCAGLLGNTLEKLWGAGVRRKFVAVLSTTIALLWSGATAPGQTCPPGPPCPPGAGDCWTGPYDFGCAVGFFPAGPNGCCDNQSFSAASLIPQGHFRGKVLFWRSHCTNCPGGPGTETRITKVYVFDPNAPANLMEVQAQLSSDLFCSSFVWDRDGQLVVAGGVSTTPGAAATETYRFFPNSLQPAVLWPKPTGPCDVGQILGSPWVFVDHMSIGRYYPGLITLCKEPIAANPPNPTTVAGGSSFVIGGAPLVVTYDYGNEFFQLLPPGRKPWRETLVPSFTPPTIVPTHTLPPGTATETYYPLPVLNPPTVMMQSYPRSFQISDVVPVPPNPPPVFRKNILVAFDLDTDAFAYPDSATVLDTWVARPRYANSSNSVWEWWRGIGRFPSGPNVFVDRLYGSAVLLHTLQSSPVSDGKNRVILIGGATQEEVPGHPGLFTWYVNPNVEEFLPGSNPANGTWVKKSTNMAGVARLFNNLIVLPTGEILVMGGATVVDAVPPYAYSPAIYNPGDSGLATGESLYTNLAIPNPNPNDPACFPFARLYHNVALLLADGRVVSAGGEAPEGPLDSRFSVDIYSPPYLGYGFRPTIVQAPTDIAFGSTISVDVQHTKNMVRLVLLRPAAVTHQFDSDQRYIELASTATGTWDPVTQPIQTFSVTAPADDLGPPGFYMLFAVEWDSASASMKAPSVAAFVRLM